MATACSTTTATKPRAPAHDEWPVVPGVRTPWAGRQGTPGAPVETERSGASIRVRWTGFWSSGEFVTYDSGAVHFPFCDAPGGWTLRRDEQEVAPAFAHIARGRREENALAAGSSKVNQTCRDATVTELTHSHAGIETRWEWSSCDRSASPAQLFLKPVLEAVVIHNPSRDP